MEKAIADNREEALAMIEALATLVQAELDKSISDITWRQYRALLFISKHTDYKREITDYKISLDKSLPSLNDLAEDMMTTRQNVKKITQGLLNKGLVVIVPDHEDKKKQLLMLTDIGHAYLEKREGIEAFCYRAFDSIDNNDLEFLKGIIEKITGNIKGHRTANLKVRTCDGKKMIQATSFRKAKVLPRRKNRPLYQLYASDGSLFELSGVNRHIVAFYDSEEAIERELTEIDSTILRGGSEYNVKYNCPVKFDSTGMPIMVRED